MKVLAALLQSDEVDVRAAAGEAVALLFEVCDLASLPESKPTGDDEEGMPQRLEDIVARMQDLATNRGDETRRSKKDRASLKGTFRELCCIVEVSTFSTLPLCQSPSPASNHRNAARHAGGQGPAAVREASTRRCARG